MDGERNAKCYKFQALLRFKHCNTTALQATAAALAALGALAALHCSQARNLSSYLES
jgi:hypothetical protein